MGVARAFYCDLDECEAHTGPITAPVAPIGWVVTTSVCGHGQNVVEYFCGWECVMKAGAKHPPPEVIPFGEIDESA